MIDWYYEERLGPIPMREDIGAEIYGMPSKDEKSFWSNTKNVVAKLEDALGAAHFAPEVTDQNLYSRGYYGKIKDILPQTKSDKRISAWYQVRNWYFSLVKSFLIYKIEKGFPNDKDRNVIMNWLKQSAQSANKTLDVIITINQKDPQIKFYDEDGNLIGVVRIPLDYSAPVGPGGTELTVRDVLKEIPNNVFHKTFSK